MLGKKILHAVVIVPSLLLLANSLYAQSNSAPSAAVAISPQAPTSPAAALEAQLVPVPDADKFKHPFYFGVTGGYGSTTWGHLVPPKEKQNAAMLLATPLKATEGGGLWGVFVGYEIIPTFALEASYSRYPNATIFYSPLSIFSFEHDGVTEVTTKTETVSLLAKFMLLIPHTAGVRAYSSAGAAEVHRYDMIQDRWRLSPTFGVGVNYNITDRIMLEVGANYTAGYGEAELDPTQDFVPFLYSVFGRLAFRIG
jgi:opacity protein-like surface antigen